MAAKPFKSGSMMFERDFRLSEINELAGDIIKQFPEARCFRLFGEMGSGKTHLTQAFCEVLGALETVSSPTYGIINIYHRQNGQEVVHADLFRLKSIDELQASGLFEYLDAPCYCFIEWPEWLPEETIIPSCWIYLEHVDENHRKIRVYTSNPAVK